MVYHMYNFLIYPSLCATIIPASRLYSFPFHRFCQFLQGHFSASCCKLPGQHTRIPHSFIAPSPGPFPVHFAFCLFICFFLSSCDYNESRIVSVNCFIRILMWFSFLGKNPQTTHPISCMLFAATGSSFPQENVLF